MLNLNIAKEANDFARGLDAKPFRKVMNKVLSLLINPQPAGSSALKGYENLLRVDIGEHRIVYRFNDKQLSVLVIGKRNDDEGYKKLARKNVLGLSFSLRIACQNIGNMISGYRKFQPPFMLNSLRKILKVPGKTILL